ncbi:hypothetical protein F8M41_016816 [Gigaspora margarita]|uniref:Uncharacterized protein n=1 Tax=Gigaspora margarita TaxID=4874 RepID=A0A8H3WUA6_GIGMA|nr:hypothetical protein F8M41_016816 [Gigaspora margarita]
MYPENFLTLHLIDNDDYDPVDNNEDLTDDDDNQSDIEAGKYLLLDLSSRMESRCKIYSQSKPNIKHPDNLEYENLQFNSIRGWVGFRMKSFLQIKYRGERRFWTAICRIRFILNESLATVKQLVNSDASPHFFQVLSDEDTCK